MDVTINSVFPDGTKQTHTFKNMTEQEKKHVDELGRMFTVKGIVIAHGFYKKYGPGVKGGEEAYQNFLSFANGWGKPEWAFLAFNIPLVVEKKRLVRPDKIRDFTRKFMGNLDEEALKKYMQSLTKEQVESAKAKIVGLSDEQFLSLTEGVWSHLRKHGLAKSRAASAAVAAVAPVAVAAATGGLAGGGHGAQNRLLMALLLGLVLWLLLKPKAGCPGRDRE